MDSYRRLLTAVGRTGGLAAVGFAKAERFEGTLVELKRRRSLGLHDGMAFTYRNPERSTDPGATLDKVSSIVVGAYRYQGPAAADGTGKAVVGQPGEGIVARVAAYAADDYYGALRVGLDRIADRLRTDGHRCIVVADANNLVDREAAVRAGLGWYGKSSNVLLPRSGSYFVLGSVLTTAELAESEPQPDGCGSCRRCLDGCPTGAIVEPGVVDARRCLAWLLQKTGPFPREYRRALGNRIYGCDDCQEVCPPNRRADGRPVPGDRMSVIELLTLTDDELLRRCDRWYIPDRDPRWIRRNALVVAGNVGRQRGDSEAAQLTRLVEEYLHHPDPILRAQALWSARRLGLAKAAAHLVDDPDPIVSQEWESATDEPGPSDAGGGSGLAVGSSIREDGARP